MLQLAVMLMDWSNQGNDRLLRWTKQKGRKGPTRLNALGPMKMDCLDPIGIRSSQPPDLPAQRNPSIRCDPLLYICLLGDCRSIIALRSMVSQWLAFSGRVKKLRKTRSKRPSSNSIDIIPRTREWRGFRIVSRKLLPPDRQVPFHLYRGVKDVAEIKKERPVHEKYKPLPLI